MGRFWDQGVGMDRFRDRGVEMGRDGYVLGSGGGDG